MKTRWIVWRSDGDIGNIFMGVFDYEDDALKAIGRAHIGGEYSKMELTEVPAGKIIEHFPPKVE